MKQWVKHWVKLLVYIVLAGSAFAGPAAAQLQPPPPELENRIPAPLPPPPQPPVINGPLSRDPSPGVIRQPHIDTPSDRVSRCLDTGANSGLSGSDLDAYTRRCVNAH